MQQKRVSGVDFAQLRRESGEILAKSSNRLTLILSILIAASPLMLCISVLSVFRLTVLLRLEGMEWLGYFAEFCVLMLFFQTVMLPLWTGLLRMASMMEQGEEPAMSELFSAFSSRQSYQTALAVSYPILFRLALLWAVELWVFVFIRLMCHETVWVLLLGIPMYLAVFTLWFLLSVSGFLNPYLAYRTSDDAPRMRPYAASVGKHYWLGFFPWIALSLLTFGILLLADTLPRMLIAYFRLCNKLNEFTVSTEDLIK